MPLAFSVLNPATVEAVAMCPTNHFESLRRAARARDEALRPGSTPSRERVFASWNLPPHMAAARREIRRVRAWNDAVGRYWNEIADAVARFFSTIRLDVAG